MDQSKKNTKAEVEVGAKSKAGSKAERRALQEAQRAAKAAKTASTNKGQTSAPKPDLKAVPSKSAEEASIPKQNTVKETGKNEDRKVGVAVAVAVAAVAVKCPEKEVKTIVPPETVAAVAVSKKGKVSKTGAQKEYPFERSRIHALFEDSDEEAEEAKTESEIEKLDPNFRRLGYQYKSKLLRGTNKRTIALLQTIQEFIKAYKTPEGKAFKHDLQAKLMWSLEALRLYRPFALGMVTAVEGLHVQLRRLKEDCTEDECKEILHKWCDQFVEEKIAKAVEAIAQKGCEKIENGDTILVFGFTDAIHEVFKLAGALKKQITIILVIAQSNSYLQDYERMKSSMGDSFKTNVSVKCINLSSIMSFISSVNKVFLGGHALFTTGGVMAHNGSSTVALCANHHNIPTIFFCETYKFCDKSPTDPFYRRIFKENRMLSGDESQGPSKIYFHYPWRQTPLVAEMRYDFTPVNLVTCVVTDIDILPSSSVPVVLRVQDRLSDEDKGYS